MAFSRDRKGNKKEGKLNKWIKTLLSGVIGAVLSAGILWLAVILQIQTQYRQNYDINITTIVVEVLLAKDSSLHPLLADLLRRVKDDSLKVALGRKILVNPTVSPETKDTIKSIIETFEPVGISESLKVVKIIASGSDPFWPYVEILFLRDDSLSLNQAKRIYDTFLENKEGFPYKPELIAIGKEWFDEDGWKPETDEPEIRYNNSNARFAQVVKSMLETEPNLEEFRMNKTTTGTPPYSVLIILPDQTE